MVETQGVSQLVAQRMPACCVIVIRTVGCVEERVVELDRGRVNMIAPGIEIDPRQPKPPRLGAVPPVADLYSAGNRLAVLWVGRAIDRYQRDGLVLVPVGQDLAKIHVPVAIDVVTDAKPEVRLFARPWYGSAVCAVALGASQMPSPRSVSNMLTTTKLIIARAARRLLKVPTPRS